MAEKYVLDTYALLALLQDEPGAQTVADLIASDETTVLMSIINLGEAFYIILRAHGEEEASTVENKVFETAKIKIAGAPWERVRAAARLKAEGGLSFADCFAAALSEESGAILVTGDPEFQPLEEKGIIRVLWLAGPDGTPTPEP